MLAFALFVPALGLYFRLWQAVFVFPWAVIAGEIAVAGIEFKRGAAGDAFPPGMEPRTVGGMRRSGC